MRPPQIRRSDYPDYMTYLDAIFAPVGGIDPHVVWDEDEQQWVLEHEVDYIAPPGCSGPTATAPFRVSGNRLYIFVTTTADAMVAEAAARIFLRLSSCFSHSTTSFVVAFA